MKFLLVLTQEGGCDYTIGCGVAVHIIEVKNREEILAQIFPWLAKHHGDPSDGYINEEIDSATLYQISDVIRLDLWQYHYDYQERLAKEAVTQIEAQEKAELERLKRKYRS